MNLDAFSPVYPQSIATDANGDLRCSDELGYSGRTGMNILTAASLEFTKVWLAELIGRKNMAEPVPQITQEAAIRGWEAAITWCACSEVASRPYREVEADVISVNGESAVRADKPAEVSVGD